MRILYISHSNGVDQGALIALRNIVLSMRELGHTPIVFFPEADGMMSKLEADGIACYHAIYRTARYPRWTGWKNSVSTIYHFLAIPIRNIIAEWHILRLIRQENIDILHLNSSVVPVGRIASRLTGTPYIIHVREMLSPEALPWHMFPSNRVFRHRLQACTHSIAITQSVHDFWGLSKDMPVVYDGVFSIEKKPEIKLEKQPYFLCIGVINSTKAQIDILHAFAQIAHRYPTYQLWLAGEGNSENPYYTELLRQIEALKLSSRVCLLGVRHDIYDLLSNATAMIAASEREGFGFTVVESMLCGCPVIGRDTAGIHEQMERGRRITGEEIGIRFRTTEELADRMAQVCQHTPSYYQPMLIRAQELVFREYSVRNNAQQLEAVYQQIIQQQ